jgi:hypothetical protein
VPVAFGVRALGRASVAIPASAVAIECRMLAAFLRVTHCVGTHFGTDRLSRLPRRAVALRSLIVAQLSAVITPIGGTISLISSLIAIVGGPVSLGGPVIVVHLTPASAAAPFSPSMPVEPEGS